MFFCHCFVPTISIPFLPFHLCLHRSGGATQLASYETHTDWITKILFLNLTDSLLSASMDSSLCLIDLTREKPKWLVKGAS